MGRGRSGLSGGASGDGVHSAALVRSLASFENRVRSNPVESAAIMDADGNVLLDKSDGNKASVSFTYSEVLKMDNAVVTHNHPSGTTFSRGDLKLMLSSNARELRVAHANGFYSLRRNYEFGDPVPSKYASFATAYTRAANKYKKDVADKYYFSSGGDSAGASKMWADYRHQWLIDNASKYGWTYTYGGL